MLNHVSLINRSIALGAAFVMALGASSCGGSDDDDGDGAATTGTTTAMADAPSQTEAQRAKATVERLYQGHRDKDPEAVCAELSGPAKTQVTQGAYGGEGVSCEESFENLFEATEGEEAERATLSVKIRKVEVTGKRAVVSVRFKAGPGEIPLVKIDGKWKLDAVGAAQPAS